MLLHLLVLPLFHAVMIPKENDDDKEQLLCHRQMTYDCSIHGDSPKDDGSNFENSVPENEI
jgi:hypothetical protein